MDSPYFKRKPEVVQWIVKSSSIIVLIGSTFICYNELMICKKSVLSFKLCLLANHHHFSSVIRYLAIIFGFKWLFLNKYITLISNFNLDQDHESIGFINKSRRLKSILFFTFTISYSSIIFMLVVGSLNNFISLLYLLLNMLNSIIWLHLLSIIIEVCINLQAVFKFFNRQIINLHKTSSPDHRPISSLKYELKIYRYHYSLGIHMMKAADQFAGFYVTWIYSEYAIYTICEFFVVFIFKTNIFSHLIFGITNAVFIYYLTANFIRVNTQSHDILEELYEISFNSYDLDFRQEIDFCLYRLSKRNVGFTYGNIFVITPNFITSIATITLSIILAIPNLLKISG